MPCYTSLSSVLNTWTIRRLPHLVPFGPQSRRTFTIYNSSRKHSPNYGKQRKERERLDAAIDENDLTATLESHRESNQASLIHHVRNHIDKSDPEVFRPSFLSDHGLTNPSARDGDNEQPPLTQNEGSSSNPLRRTGYSPYEGPVKYNLHKKVPSDHKIRAFLKDHEHLVLPTTPPLSKEKTPNTYLNLLLRARRVIWRMRAIEKIPKTKKLSSVPDHLLDYQGSASRLKTSNRDPLIPEPWAIHPLSDKHTPRERLDQEIGLFVEWMSPTVTEEVARKAVRDEALSLIRLSAPEFESEPFGSQITGLAMPMSDLDIRVYRADDAFFQLDTDQKKENVRESIQKIFDSLQANPNFTLVAKHYAPFPLVQATHVASGLAVQIVASRDTSASREKIKSYLAEYPTLKTLFLVVKTIFDMRDLSGVWKGGLGSYAIFIMVVASLKHSNTNTKPTDSIAQQLLDFTNFFAERRFHAEGISVEPPVLFSKQKFYSRAEVEAAGDDEILQAQISIGRRDRYMHYLMCLQDPVNPYNDLGSKTLAIRNIQTTLKALHSYLHEAIKGGASSAKNIKDGPMQQTYTLLRPIVGRCDQLYDDSRVKLDLYGDHVASQGDKSDQELPDKRHNGEIN